MSTLDHLRRGRQPALSINELIGRASSTERDLTARVDALDELLRRQAEMDRAQRACFEAAHQRVVDEIRAKGSITTRSETYTVRPNGTIKRTLPLTTRDDR
jgi:hypothetical protein